jgi:YegS/Rv2252/BmrU family lipid kinase
LETFPDMKILFLVNPAAGHGRGERRFCVSAAALLKKLPGIVLRTTLRPGDGSLLARQGLEEGFEAIIAVGGDGTLGEVVDGYLGAPVNLRSGAVLGTWPVGSGCDFARHMGIHPEVGEFLSRLDGPKILRLDAGLVECESPSGRMRRYFLNVAAVGLAGDVALRVQAGGKSWGGTLSYMASSLVGLLHSKPRPLDLVIDGVTQQRGFYHMVVLANTSTFGGGMHVAPGADPKDGLLDCVLVEGLSRWGLLRRFPLIYAGAHLGSSGISLRRVSCLEAKSTQRVPLNIDGEAIGFLPAHFQVFPGAVPFLC